MRKIIGFALAMGLFALSGCVSSINNIPVYINPASATINTGQSLPFTVTVGSSPLTASVTWSVNGVVGGSPSSGTITSSGLYTAPAVVPSPNTVTVSASVLQTNGQNDSLNATVTIVGTTVTPPTPSASISVSPSIITVDGTATLSWSSANVNSCLINNSSLISGISVGTAGSVSVSPTTTTPYQITCTGPNGSATAQTTLTVQPALVITVSINPSAATLTSGGTLEFSAIVTNDTSGQGVFWTSSFESAPVATGLLSATYTAPSVSENTDVQIAAVSVANPNVSATAAIVLVPQGGGGGTGGCTSPPASANPPQAGILPNFVNITPGATVDLTATLSGDDVTSQAFTWSLKTTQNTANIGTITPTGVNTATYQGANVTSLTTVQVIATSQQYTCIMGYATIGVVPAN